MTQKGRKVSMSRPMKPIHEKILEQAKPFLRTRKNLIHTRIALRYALTLLQSEGGDEHVVVPAILLHDVGWTVIPEPLHLDAFGPNPSNPKLMKIHEREGVKIAKSILDRLHYPRKQIEEICRIIRGHDSRKRPVSVNDRLVKDADKLWRYSQKGFAIDTRRFNLSRTEYLAYLEGKIDEWFLTPTAKTIARQEIAKRSRLLP